MIGLARPSLVVALVGCGLFACHAKNDAFYERVFPCDLAAPVEDCGTGRSGQALTCYDARQLGGQSVCSEICGDGESEGAHDGYACLASRVRLKLCRPAASKTNPALGCPAGLNCLRTDLIRDEGLCMAVPVCTEDADCAGDAARRKCAGTLLRENYPTAPLLTDNLHCLQDSCRATLSACSPGESCLGLLEETSPDAPDICAPNCDADMRCPPNFVCSREVSGTGAPRVCLPGLPGNRCTSNIDCILGDCVDTGEGFNVCTIPCINHEGCVPLITRSDAFVCVPNLADSGHHCVSQRPFSGQPCRETTDCPDGSICYLYSPYGTQTPTGECRPPCDAEGNCRPRGGIPSVCLAGGAGGCYPGRFGLPCKDSAECMYSFSCLAVPEDAELGAPADDVCTIPCAADADCDANPWTLAAGYCVDGFCRLGGGPGAPCTRDTHCRERTCDVGATGAIGTCPGDPGP
jgi:hypothetical protein